MPKVSNQKVKLLYIADYIVRKSDDENGFYIKDIKEHLEDKGIKADYHSITDDIKLLRDQFGMDIDGGGGNGRPFYLLSHHFKFEDVSAIAECVGSAKFLSEAEAIRLTRILKELCSEKQEEKINIDYFVLERPRTTQEDLRYTLGVIRDAIKNKEKIIFKYTTRSLKGFSKTYRRQGEDYRVSPYRVVLSEGNHYLIGFDEKRKKITSFRVSRIDKVKNAFEPQVGEKEYQAMGISDYARQTFGMFIGPKAKRLTLICDNDLLDTMVERFGTTAVAEYRKRDEKHFTISTSIVPSPMFYGWLCGLGGKAIIEDSGEEDSTAKKYLDYLEKVKSKQQKSIE